MPDHRVLVPNPSHILNLLIGFSLGGHLLELHRDRFVQPLELFVRDV